MESRRHTVYSAAMVVDKEAWAGAIDAALVQRLIAAQFPQWASLPIKPVEPGGWDNRTFRLGDGMSVRLPSAARYVAQVAKEHRWLPELAAQLPLPIPAPIAKGAPGGGYPWPWSVYRWREGSPAAPETIADLDEFARTLGRFLTSLYHIDATSGPPAGAHNFHRGGELSVYDGETRAALAALKDRIDEGTAGDIWTAALASKWQEKPVWVHGDMATGNLLVEKGKLCAVIDFGSSGVGDPACDLVIAWTLFAGDNRQAFRSAVALDEATWSRARGWALWKALITAAGHDSNQREAGLAWTVIEDLVAEHRAS
jgi:aminoglycoside phosphotransferase (APT) family kinase protein